MATGNIHLHNLCKLLTTTNQLNIRERKELRSVVVGWNADHNACHNLLQAYYAGHALMCSKNVVCNCNAPKNQVYCGFVHRSMDEEFIGS